jgi:hypothetical protein
MSTLEIRTRDGKTQFRPQEIIEGAISWQLDASAEALELRLIWFTQGKGDTDVSVEDTRRFEAPALSGDSNFRFQLPAAPYSFSGKLISLSWALEFVVMPGSDATRFEFSLSPSGSEVLLPVGEGDPSKLDTSKLNTSKLPAWLRARVQPKTSVLQQRNPFEK